MAGEKQTLGFQAEVTQLLHLMVHSLYSEQGDLPARARLQRLGRLRQAALRVDVRRRAVRAGPGAAHPRRLRPRRPHASPCPTTGIGMSRDEVIQNIGTIAKSGTREFFQRLTGDQAKDANLIGQFGVGFYSSFIVADRVTLLTRRAGMTAEHGVRWESDGRGRVQPSRRWTVRRAAPTSCCTCARAKTTCSTDYRLRTILRKYSDHITHPILMKKEEWNEDAGKQPADRRRRAGQPGVGAVDAVEERDHRRPVRRVLQARGARPRGAARLDALAGRRAAGIHAAAATSRRTRRWTCGTATTGTASSSTCAASSSWTTPST